MSSGVKALAARVGAWYAVSTHGSAARPEHGEYLCLDDEVYSADHVARAMVLATRWELPERTEGLTDDQVADIVLARLEYGAVEPEG